MSYREPEQHLRDAWQRLCQAWLSSAALWQDGVRTEFEQSSWQEFEQQTGQYSASLTSLMEALNNARQAIAD